MDRIDTVYSPRCKTAFKRKRKGHLLYLNNSRNGYLSVSINDNNYLVHRIVASAFYGLPQDNQVVNHLNGIKNDNRVENLEWTTSSLNELHSYKVLNKKVWNKGIKFYNPNAIKSRKENYAKKCIETYKHILDNKLTITQASISLSLCRETIYNRIKYAKEVLNESI